jgi:hypothetical protein
MEIAPVWFVGQIKTIQSVKFRAPFFNPISDQQVLALTL